MSRPCFFAPQTFEATHAFSTRTQASRRATTGSPKRCDQSSGCCLFRRVYSDGGDVIPAGITATEARYECRASARYAPGGLRSVMLREATPDLSTSRCDDDAATARAA